MSEQILKESPHLPTDDRALARLRRAIELGELEQLPTVPGIPNTPRYLVTYMNSQTADSAMRSATVISVTDQSELINRVFVTFFKGFTDDSSPVGMAAFAIPPQFTVNFASRHLLGTLTVTNAVPDPDLTSDEGRAISRPCGRRSESAPTCTTPPVTPTSAYTRSRTRSWLCTAQATAGTDRTSADQRTVFLREVIAFVRRPTERS